jgi:hypothetical protein
MTTLFADDWAARSSGRSNPIPCAGPRSGAVGPFGNEGRRRCVYTATVRATATSSGGRELRPLAVCAEHTPEGRLGVTTPTGWTWVFAELAATNKSPSKSPDDRVIYASDGNGNDDSAILPSGATVTFPPRRPR